MPDPVSPFSAEHLLQLAPNAKVLAQARKLFFARRWKILEGNGKWIWGEYEMPYGDLMRAAVRFEPPSLKCSCKSRQKPCKHSLALVLLFLNRQEVWKVKEDPPDWVLHLMSVARVETKETNAPANSSNARQQKRLELMDNGVEELEKWLSDTMRQGLGQLNDTNGEALEHIAARMVDGKLPSIARKLRLCKELLQQENWPDLILGELGMLFLFVRAWQRKSSLEPDQKRELMQVAGWPVQKANLLTQKGVVDHWLAIGQTFYEEEKLMARRTWFIGEKSGQKALLLDFSFGGRGFEDHWLVGAALKGELVFYPGISSVRAVFKNHLPSRDGFDLPGAESKLSVVLEEYNKALAKSLWLREYPLYLGEMSPIYNTEKDVFFLIDGDKNQIKMETSDRAWQLLAIAGGQPIRVFGELRDALFYPLSVIQGGRVIELANY